jgi:hypothetical protein
MPMMAFQGAWSDPGCYPTRKKVVILDGIYLRDGWCF